LHDLDESLLFLPGSFAAHLDFHLVLWLSGERARRARVADFVLALMRLHTQFRWPYPLASGIFVEQMNRRIGEMSLGRSSCSSLASLDEGLVILYFGPSQEILLCS
jgi:hypothetical protein